MQVLLAIASLSRVVEWEAEKQFWNFNVSASKDNDDKQEKPLTFVKSSDRENSKTLGFRSAVIIPADAGERSGGQDGRCIGNFPMTEMHMLSSLNGVCLMEDDMPRKRTP